MTDYSALQIQVSSYVGTNTSPLDITDLVDTIAPIRNTAIDPMTGYDKTETTILLVSNTPGELETRFNTRWALDNRITFIVAGVLHRSFRILDAFFDDGTAEDSQRPGINSLELELGDYLAWRDRAEPPPGDIDIPVLANSIDVPILTTLNYWLQAFGLSQVTIAAGDETPQERITTTGLYSGGTSILEHLGGILRNCRFVLWSDAQERIRLRRIGLPPTTTDYTWQSNRQRVQWYKAFPDALAATLAANQIGFTLTADDLLINKRSKSDREKVPGTLRVAGMSLYRYPYSDPPPETSYSNENGVIISETFDMNTGLTTRTTTRSGQMLIEGLANQAGTKDPGRIGNYVDQTIEVFGGSLPGSPNPNPALPPWPGVAAHLLSKTQTLQEQRPDSSGVLQPIAITKEYKIANKYRRTDAVVQGVLVRGVEISEILETTSLLPKNGTVLKIDQFRKQKWRYLAPGIYAYSETIVRPGDVENRQYSKTTSNTGRSTPPQTDWAPQTIVPEQHEIYAEAQFNYPPGSPVRGQRTYQVGAYLDNNQAASLLAQLLGALLIGRNEAQLLAFRPSTAWLTDPKPCQWVTVDYSSTEQDLYLLDVPVLTITNRRAYLGGSGIYYGRRNIATGNITTPYEIAIAVQGWGNEVTGYGNELVTT